MCALASCAHEQHSSTGTAPTPARRDKVQAVLSQNNRKQKSVAEAAAVSAWTAPDVGARVCGWSARQQHLAHRVHGHPDRTPRSPPPQIILLSTSADRLACLRLVAGCGVRARGATTRSEE